MTKYQIAQATTAQSITEARDVAFIARGQRAVQAARDYNVLRGLLQDAEHQAHIHDLEDVENAVVDALGRLDTVEAATP